MRTLLALRGLVGPADMGVQQQKEEDAEEEEEEEDVEDDRADEWETTITRSISRLGVPSAQVTVKPCGLGQGTTGKGVSTSR
jgi:hypothetical protein